VAVIGVAATIALHFVMQAAGPNPYFIAGVCLFWAVFVAVRAWQRPGVLRAWGFRADNLVRAAVLPGLLLLVIAGGCAAYAAVQGQLQLPLHALPLFLLYPAWGVFQQFLALGIVVNHLEKVRDLRRRPGLVALVAAALFGAVHAGDLRLVAGTFVLELLLVPLYLQSRNLWPLGLVHGWAGGLFYLWVLRRDLWLENFG
jgi:hypothetical protein